MPKGDKSIIAIALSRIRIRIRLLFGGLFKLAGVPGLVRDCRYESRTANAEITVKAGTLFTIISVNGLDIYFHRLTGSIDGVGTTSCRPVTALPQAQLHELSESAHHNAQRRKA
jgi:hypothetical protein